MARRTSPRATDTLPALRPETKSPAKRKTPRRAASCTPSLECPEYLPGNFQYAIAMPTQQPNFLLFITDQQRADHLGCYGNRIVRTPAIDALARAGWCAEEFYTATPICMP